MLQSTPIEPPSDFSCGFVGNICHGLGQNVEFSELQTDNSRENTYSGVNNLDPP